ncbi:MAG: hypothetical protein ACFFCS_10650 [Candidatus Hodarchaeota archaeon]
MILVFFYIDQGTKGNPEGMSPVIPGNDLVDYLIIFIAPVAVSVVFVFLAIVFTPFYVFLARLMKGKKYGVARQELALNELSAGNVFARTFLASLIPLAFAISINSFLVGLDVQFVEANAEGYSIAALTVFISPVSVLLLMPTWILSDLGIVFYKKKNMEETAREKGFSEPYDVMSVGSFYGYLFKGFAGISTPIVFVYVFLGQILESGVEPDDVIMAIIALLTPVLLIGIYALPTWIYIKLYPSLERKLFKKKNYPTLNLKFELKQREQQK